MSYVISDLKTLAKVTVSSTSDAQRNSVMNWKLDCFGHILNKNDEYCEEKWNDECRIWKVKALQPGGQNWNVRQANWEILDKDYSNHVWHLSRKLYKSLIDFISNVWSETTIFFWIDESDQLMNKGFLVWLPSIKNNFRMFICNPVVSDYRCSFFFIWFDLTFQQMYVTSSSELTS